jgi:hypothetical protein
MDRYLSKEGEVMNIVLVILSFLTALIPIADRGMQQWQTRQVQVQTVMKPVLPPEPPEVGQPNVVFRDGAWWKYENGNWLVWRQNSQLAQGGSNVVR